jgi:hypothetical protein
MSKITGIELDFETADKITLLTMKEQLGYLKKELKNHHKKGTWMHPEDVYNSEHVLIPALEVLIDYYGG